MNRRLTDRGIRSTCRELLVMRARVTGRQLRAELRERFGAVGRTERVFRIWREESKAARTAALPVEHAALQRRLAAAEQAAAENLARAERAEYREQAHQATWAVEIDRLRQEVKSLRAGRGW